MSTYLAIGPQTRVLKSAIIAVEAVDPVADLFMSKFGMKVEDDGMTEIRVLTNTGKSLRTRVKTEDVPHMMQSIYDALGWH